MVEGVVAPARVGADDTPTEGRILAFDFSRLIAEPDAKWALTQKTGTRNFMSIWRNDFILRKKRSNKTKQTGNIFNA